MVYPHAPWMLKGYALQTVQLLDITKVRSFIPQELEIISTWPGKTLGGIYLSSYGNGSVLEYNELIIVAGMVSYAGHWGAWISHIYVDNPDSVMGGREVWGLPKQLADFDWSENSVRVYQGNNELCSLSWQESFLPLSSVIQLPLNGPVISRLNDNFLLFQGDFSSRIGLVDATIKIGPETPFLAMDLEQPWLTVYCDKLNLVAGVPEVIGEETPAFSY